MKRLYITILVFSLFSILPTHSQTVISQLQYWIDNGEKKEVAFSGESVSFVIDASNVSEGLHTLSYRVKDSEGLYSVTNTWIFLRKGNGTETSGKDLLSFQYWIDNGEKKEETFNGKDISFAIDASNVSEGLHVLSYRVKNSEGLYSLTQAWIFLRKGIEENLTAKNLVSCQYWIDNGEKKEETFSEKDVSFAIDASNVAEGLHTLRYRVKDSEGMYSPIKTWIFLRKGNEPDVVENKVVQVEYWFDNDVTNKQTKMLEEETFTFSTDASNLQSGNNQLPKIERRRGHCLHDNKRDLYPWYRSSSGML